MDGGYRPGTPLSEVALASVLGMSRTPIREALVRLWQEGYLDRVTGHGYFVAHVTAQAIHDTFEVRRLLEGAAAGRAAAMATPGDVEELRRLARMPKGPHAYRDVEAANARFHLAVARCARNLMAVELIERCLGQIDRFIALGVSFSPLQAGATETHLEIVAAIASHDAEAACARMQAHLDCGSSLLKEALFAGEVPAVRLR